MELCCKQVPASSLEAMSSSDFYLLLQGKGPASWTASDVLSLSLTHRIKWAPTHWFTVNFRACLGDLGYWGWHQYSLPLPLLRRWMQARSHGQAHDLHQSGSSALTLLSTAYNTREGLWVLRWFLSWVSSTLTWAGPPVWDFHRSSTRGEYTDKVKSGVLLTLLI